MKAHVFLAALLLAATVGTFTGGIGPSFAALPPGASQYSYSDDCTKMVFISNEELYIADADGSNAVKLTDVDDSISAAFPRLSPDNSQVAFLNNHLFYVINSDGTGLTKLADFFSGGAWPSWSPDGSKVAFMFSLQVYTVNPDGTGLTNLTPGIQSQSVDGDDNADWSPDGTKIVFDRVVFTGVDEHNVVTATHDLVLVSPDGTGMATLLDHGGYPRWAHDGAKIYFSHNSGIYSVEPDGTDETFVGNLDIETVLCGQVADSSPPSIAITSPANGATVGNSFTASGTASDVGSGLKTVEVSVNGGPYQPAAGTSSGTFAVTGLPSGTATISARATDNAGNTRSASIQVSVPITVAIDAKGSSGETLHMWTQIASPGGLTQTGFAPMSVNGPAGNYAITVHDYGSIVFDHWSDGSTSRARTLTTGEDTTLTAYYTTG